MASTKKKADLQAIVPTVKTVEVDGVEYRVKRLRLLELASLMRVVTAGAGPALVQLGEQWDEEKDAGVQIATIVMLSVPNAIAEFVDFLNVVLEPVEEGEGLTLINPDLDDVIDVIGIMVEQEKDDLQGLVGKARKMWEMQVAPLLPSETGSQN